MPFADVYAGFEQAASDHYSKLLQMQWEQKKALSEFHAKMADNPAFDEASRQAHAQIALDTIGGDPMKPAKAVDVSKMMVQPPAPPPVKAPGGPGAQNMPIGQQLAGPGSPTPPGLAQIQGGYVPPLESPQGGPQPQAPPNTGPTGQIAGQTIQAPAPAPHPLMQMLPFEERMKREAAESVAKSSGQYGIAGMKAAIPTKQGVDTVQGDDGRRYHSYIYQRRNPTTGEIERFNIQEDQPLGFFAPRSGAVNTVANLKKWQAEGNMVLNPDGKPLDLSQMQDTDILQHIGEDRYVPVTEKQRIQDIGGYQRPVGEITANMGAPVAVAPGQLPNLREVLVPGPGGTQKKVVLASQRELQPPTSQQAPGVTPQAKPAAPVAPPPQAPPGMAVPPILNQGPFFQGQPGQPKVITPALISQLMAIPENQAQGVTPQDIIDGLKNVGFQEPAAAPAPTPPPQQGSSLQRGTVTEVPGAGRRLGAKDIETSATRAGVLGTTLGRGANVLNTFDQIVGSSQKLDSFLKRAQLQIVSNPASPTKFSLLVQNKSNLSPAEAQFAADYASLGEDINVMRAITNATGFRGKEAFEVLQGQRGTLLGNPEVFKRTLQNSLRTIITQLGPLKRQLESSDYKVQDTKDIINGYRAVFTNPKDLETALRNDGWIQ